MDIHRCRFVPYPSSAINALAFSHPSNLSEQGSKLKTLRLAIGRADGDIEIWNPQGGDWFQESILRGGKSRSIEALVWTQDTIQRNENSNAISGKLRLFSIGYSSVITEWDLALGKAIRHCDGNFGEIWCLAAQPRRKESNQKALKSSFSSLEADALPAQQILAGCADGTLSLHSTEDEDLRFLRAIGRSTKKRARVLSAAFLTYDRVVAGYADGTLRVYGTEKGQGLGTMTLGKTSRNTASAVLVWSVKVLPDRTIVSGDSSGHVTFWDGEFFTRLQSLQCHTADILDLAVSADGNTVMSAGMDRKSIFYQRARKAGKGAFGRFTKTLLRRYHEHDVKALASYESKDLSVVASGGLDTTPIIIPFRDFATANHRRLPYLEQRPALRSASSKRLIMSWWGQEVNVWRLGKRRESKHNDTSSPEPSEEIERTLVLKLLLKIEENISDASLAADGSMLAVATMSEVKLFRLRRSKRSMDILRAQKIELPEELATQGARVLRFSPDSKWLAVADSKNSLCIDRIAKGAEANTIQVLKQHLHLRRTPPSRIEQEPYHDQHGSYDRSISHLAFSDDSRILVSASLDGKMDGWVLEGYEDLTQNGDSALVNGVANNNGKNHSDISDDELGHDDESQQSSPILLGQRWIRNPAPAFPSLPSAPLILSFRATDTTATHLLTNGNVGLHATRHNAHPHSHDLPSGEDRLLVVTSEHGLYEYNALTGKLSDWSRRNSTNLPSRFLRNRDRVMGLLWDIGHGRERLWLYGISWLGMFDLAKNFPVEVPLSSKTATNETSEDTAMVNGTRNSKHPNRKRKREILSDEREEILSAEGSGIGDSARTDDNTPGIKAKHRISHGPDVERASDLQILRPSDLMPSDEDSDEEDDEDAAYHGGSSALVRPRRASQPSEMPNGHLSDQHESGDAAVVNGRRDHKQRNRADHSAFWCTQRYRPILGIVPIGGEDEEDATDEDVEMVDASRGKSVNRALEVALVERPLWDVDLPGRLVDD